MLRDIPVVAVATVVLDLDRVVLVRESKPAALGRWSLPGGRVENGESLEAAAVRETVEESGLMVELSGLVGIYHCLEMLEGGAAVNFVFSAVATGGELAPSNAHPDVGWFEREQARQLAADRLLRGQHTLPAIDASLAGRVLGDVVTEVGASLPPPRSPDATEQR